MASDAAFLQLRDEFTKTMKYGAAIDAAVARKKALVDGTAAAVTPEEIALKEYGQVQRLNATLNQQRSEVQAKYGKMLYHLDAGTLSIYRKYPNMESLYQGPLL